ncbi:TonB-dependent receptor plug domain-containing protein [Desertivirga xinjiangensis]|uniref:TonB-dependent receptor plug domain-containing protein n=1 Tax=Desertivirga xinjiangensis TaxID=539206 RepID=UPI00210AB7B0|nr:TonB-dependent receptor [Pedobacter xinjiangensis]
MAKTAVFKILILTAIISVSNYSGSYAQLIDTLKEVEVIGNRIAIDTTLNPAQILTAKQLQRTNSFSVADAVRHFSGVQLKDYGGVGGLKTINVRSLGSLHTSVFYDGLELGNAQNGQVDLGKFSLDNIEVIELYNGQSDKELLPARAFSLANSLFIQSKKPNFNAGGRSNIQGGLKTGSFGLFNPSFTWQQKITKRIYSSISSEWQKASGAYKFKFRNGDFDTVRTRNNTDLDALRLEAGLFGNGADSSIWAIQAYMYRSDRGLPRAIVDNVDTSNQRLSDDEFFSQVSYNRPVSDRYQVILRGKYSYSYSRYKDPDWLGSNPIDNWYKQNELYFSVANRFAVSEIFNVSLAADMIHSIMDAKIDLSRDEVFPQPSRLTGLLALTSSLNLKHFDLQGSLLSTSTRETVKFGESAYNKQAFTPTLSAAWKPFFESNFQLRGLYKSSFRLPTFNDQYYTLIGNTALKPEYSTQYTLGVSYSKAFEGALSYLSMKIDGYHNKIKDKIVAIPTSSLFLWTMTNLGKVDINGIESSVKSELKVSSSGFIAASLNYTYQKAIEVTPGYYYKQVIPYAPKHSGTASLSLIQGKYTVNYNFLYTSERYGLRTIDRFSNMKPWSTHDISASREFGAGKNRLTLRAELNNLLNKKYAVVRNYPMPGRSFRLSIKYALSN